MLRWKSAWPALCVLTIGLVLTGGAAGQTAPDALVKGVANEVLAIIKADREIQGGNPKRFNELLDAKLLPHFDFSRMTAMAMGRNWKKATPQQQQELTAEFRTLLVRTYAGALANYKDHTIEYKPLRMQPADTEAVVRTQVMQPGAQPIAIDYSMAKAGEAWKAYDVVVAGVSLVTNYRDEFNNMVRDAGIEGLIKALADKNRGSAAKK
ncbi:Intermembrane phospholipid transport system binding protein MlaC [Burkholderiales bacterium]|nr:MAG: ABC transporter substrate-binding protein [Burkholderiales bacterium]CAG1008207.1 Intermembrane phospholipid transport system binding protein MlaC [Burkholderiales bacterium]